MVSFTVMLPQTVEGKYDSHEHFHSRADIIFKSFISDASDVLSKRKKRSRQVLRFQPQAFA